MSEIEAQIEELNKRPGKFREEEIALAGAIVTVENQGLAVIHRGLVRSEDKAKWKKLNARSKAPDESDTKKQEDNKTELAAVLVEELTRIARRPSALNCCDGRISLSWQSLIAWRWRYATKIGPTVCPPSFR
jgi:F0F1-type ATP synthase epsilon subunit